MTDAQAVQIKELRMKGMGYRTIAETVGLTRDIVRNYCKANDMAGYAKATAMNPVKMAQRIIESVDMTPAPLRIVLGSQALRATIEIAE